ncbi:MAG: hypothetical protein KDA75_11160 [Planctomycetaceae bacterium]|nr:hypothetical protein [Planctomycetaceae bacterium]
MFVLPRDPYPAPPDAERIKKKPKPKSKSRRQNGSEAEADSAPVRVSRHKRRREQQDGGGNPLTTAASATSSAFLAAAGTVGRATRGAAHGTASAATRTARGFIAFWTPLKLTALGTCVLLVAMAFWMIRSRQIEQAERDLNPAIEEGLAALQDGDIPTAAARLQTAVAALDLLGNRDRHSDSVRQVSREATALNGLASETLFRLLEEADEYVDKAAQERPEPDPEADEPPPPLDAAWVNRFGGLYQGGWVVMEAPVRRLKPTDTEPHRYEVEFPIRIGSDERPVELRADFTAFEALGLADAPRTVVFGGKLQSCRYLEDEQRFQVRLEPSSGFVWVNLPTYRRLGFGFNDWHREEQIRALLTEQSHAINAEPLLKEEPVETPQLPAG